MRVSRDVSSCAFAHSATLLSVFRHEGPSRDPKKNLIVAAALACIAGFANLAGFILLGAFTSHVTGSVGRLAADLSRFDWPATGFALILVFTFFLGAALASLLVESAPTPKRPRAYGIALVLEATLLIAFLASTALAPGADVRWLDAQASLLCLAMGMQNSLITRLSGAVVRTTHLTGVVTDLGIEAARWLRWARRTEHATRPDPVVARLLLIIATAFTVGAIAGALLTRTVGPWSLAVPAAGLLLLSWPAFSGRPT